MRDTLNAADMRRWAMQCAAHANEATCSGADRERLMRMRESLLALADNADWLAGKSTGRLTPAVEATEPHRATG